MEQLSPDLEERLLRLAKAMVDQTSAKIVVPPYDPSTGFWFGGGNLIKTPNGFYLVGRYRNHGDSRTGLKLGERGLELALFHADEDLAFHKVHSWSKSDLDVGDRTVLSIEGSAIHVTDTSWELFVSTEKANIAYPDEVRAFLKPGAGVWTIDRLAGDSLDELKGATPNTFIESNDPPHLHVKDPNLHQAANGDLQLLYCTHPFGWSSSNTAYVVRDASQALSQPRHGAFPRGATWDVAMTRVTCVVDVPSKGDFEALDWMGHKVSLVFYDGGESLRRMDEHDGAVRRPRGYSCEELGGVGYITDDNLNSFRRLSRLLPTFVSPYGTGCSRYVQSLWTDDGYITTWQQSQDDLSQPLVLHRLGASQVHQLLS